VQLAGFSTHYNISFDIPDEGSGSGRTVERLAYLLTHIVPFPVMLLGANRRSTGIGVRPRLNRVEITADFTPDPALMIAAATVIVATTRQVMRWPTFELSELDRHALPMIAGFAPEKHSSRKGWVARHSSFPVNPFTADVDDSLWQLTDGAHASLRSIAARIIGCFDAGIARYADRRTRRLITAVLDGRSHSLLELADRPAAYDSVGVLCTWENLFPVRTLSRSRYERVLIRAISGQPIQLDNEMYKPVGMRGWSHVVFSRTSDGARRTLSLDFLLEHLEDWEVGRRTEARLRRTLARRERLRQI
jgi:hypothetical protein